MDDSQVICSGALFYSLKTKRLLLLRRSPGKSGDTWGIVSGTNNQDEIPYNALLREINEEIGFVPDIIKTIPLELFISDDCRFLFHTYLIVVEQEFIPNLNHENNGYAWTSFLKWPHPLHRGLKNTLQNRIIISKLKTIFKMIDFFYDNQDI